MLVAASQSNVINSMHTSLVHAFYTSYSTAQHHTTLVHRKELNKDVQGNTGEWIQGGQGAILHLSPMRICTQQDL